MKTLAGIFQSALLASIIVLLHFGLLWSLIRLPSPQLPMVERPQPIQISLVAQALPQPTVNPVAEPSTSAPISTPVEPKPQPKPKPVTKPKPKPVTKPKPKPVTKPEPKPVAKPEPKPEPVAAKPRPESKPEPMPPLSATSRSSPPQNASDTQNIAKQATSKTAAAAPQAQPTTTTTPPVYNANYLHNPPPSYPRLAKRRREQGTVLLAVHVAAQGHVLALQLKRSSGSRSLDQAAESTVRNWRFIPAKRGNTPIAAWVNIPITFTLE